MVETPPALVRITTDPRRADEWALALASAAIDCRIERAAAGYAVLVPESDRAAAAQVLDAFDEENRAAPAPVRPAPTRSHGALILVALLSGMFVVTGPRAQASIWFQRGAAVAWRINDGEPWRTVTALMLHADFLHLLANIVTLAIFGTALYGMVGAGTGTWILLLAGAGGNWMNAALRGTAHSAVGASTAIFGGIGALAALQLIRRSRGSPVPAARAWAPLAAGVALLGFLGTAPESDVLAHLFGFAAGVGLGALAVLAAPWSEHRAVQWPLCAAAAIVAAACWITAFTRP